MLAVEIQTEENVEITNKLEDNQDIYFSIFFTGEVYGELLIGLDKKTAMRLLDISHSDLDYNQIYLQNHEDILETFKEVINISAGQALSFLKSKFKQITITPPRVIEGKLVLSRFELNKVSLTNNSGTINCYVYIDKMKLDVAYVLEEDQLKIKEESIKQEELKRLNKAKTEFLANMSHELRTPLNGIIGMMDILKTSQLDDTQKEQVAIVCQSGEFLLELISDILDFSKIESGRFELQKEPFDLRKCLENISETMAISIYKKNLDFNVIISENLNDSYIGDETRFKQVIVNLIGNAIKFTPTGSITLKAEQKEKELVVSVSDTGIGIPKNKITKIFESFNQADLSDTKRYGGTGLGLTISRNIVEKMGGQIIVESKEALGTTFKIKVNYSKEKNELIKFPNLFYYTKNKDIELCILNYIPNAKKIVEIEIPNDSIILVNFEDIRKVDKVYIEEVKNKNAKIIFLIKPNQIQNLNLLKSFGIENFETIRLPLLRKTLETSLLKDKADVCFVAEEKNTTNKILLVEDNQVNQLVAKTMLKKLGYEVDTAFNGVEALAMYKKNNYDLVLMDCQMPEMDGYEASRQIRILENEQSHLPIIALTANALKESKEQCFEAGMDDFATKPIKMDSLKEVIERVLNRFSQ